MKQETGELSKGRKKNQLPIRKMEFQEISRG